MCEILYLLSHFPGDKPHASREHMSAYRTLGFKSTCFWTMPPEDKAMGKQWMGCVRYANAHEGSRPSRVTHNMLNVVVLSHPHL